VRAVFIIVLIAALVSLTAPASAHANHDHTSAGADADLLAHSPGGAPDHDVDHNPTDHSHPMGEDTHHEKAFHSSFDVADCQAIAMRLARIPRAANLPFVDEASRGLEPAPPIRPPLG